MPKGSRSHTSSTWCSVCAAPSSWTAAAARSLSRPADEITMAEVVEALEGDIAPIECISAQDDGTLVCSREAQFDRVCPTKVLWTRVQGSIVRTLKDITLSELVVPNRKKATV